MRRFHRPTACPCEQSPSVGLPGARFSPVPGLWAFRLITFLPTDDRHLRCRSDVAGQLTALFGPFPSPQHLELLGTPYSGPGSLSRHPAFPWAYCLSSCEDRAPWAGSPDDKFLRLVSGLRASRLIAFLPAYGRHLRYRRDAAGQLTASFSPFPSPVALMAPWALPCKPPK